MLDRVSDMDRVEDRARAGRHVVSGAVRDVHRRAELAQPVGGIDPPPVNGSLSDRCTVIGPAAEAIEAKLRPMFTHGARAG